MRSSRAREQRANERSLPLSRERSFRWFHEALVFETSLRPLPPLMFVGFSHRFLPFASNAGISKVLSGACFVVCSNFGIAHDYGYLHASILTGSPGGKYHALAVRLADRAQREHCAVASRQPSHARAARPPPWLSPRPPILLWLGESWPAALACRPPSPASRRRAGRPRTPCPPRRPPPPPPGASRRQPPGASRRQPPRASGMRHLQCEAYAGDNQKAGISESHGIHDHPMPILFVALPRLVSA